MNKWISIGLCMVMLSSTLGIVLPEPTVAQPSSGLVAYWPFDEGTGTIAHDASGNGNDGTLINGPIWTANGVSGSALEFDGTDDIVHLPVSIFSNPSQVSFDAWVKPTELKNCVIVQSGVGGHLSLEYRNDGRFQFGLWHSDVTWTRVQSLSHPINKWYNVVGVWVNMEYLKIYVNGIEEGSIGVSKALGDPGSHYPFAIGAYSTGSELFFKGFIDEVRIYDRALTASEVSDLYTNNGSSSGSTLPPWLFPLLAVIIIVVVVGVVAFALGRRSKVSKTPPQLNAPPQQQFYQQPPPYQPPPSYPPPPPGS